MDQYEEQTQAHLGRGRKQLTRQRNTHESKGMAVKTNGSLAPEVGIVIDDNNYSADYPPLTNEKKTKKD